jgi:hypothetical protein
VGVYRPVRYEVPAAAGDYDHALHTDHPGAPSFLDAYMQDKPAEPKLGGAPNVTAQPTETEKAFPTNNKDEG